jgi:hypothetical protein
MAALASRLHRRLRGTVLAMRMLSVPVLAVASPRLADVGLLDTIGAQTGVARDSRLATTLTRTPLALARFAWSRLAPSSLSLRATEE